MEDQNPNNKFERTEPLLLLFAETELVTYVCFECGQTEERNCLNDKKFKTFVKQKAPQGKCDNCKSTNNLFRNPHGVQFWINYKDS